jgi:hypothetical protein
MVEITKEKVQDLRNTVVSFFKEMTDSEVEVEEWHFNTLKAKDGNRVDLGAKIFLKPKKKTR